MYYSPRFCYSNYITNDDITVSTNSDIKTRLIDRNVERKWISTSGDQTATVTIAINKTIDTIIIQNTNMLDFSVKYNSGSQFNPEVSDENSSQEAFTIVDEDNNYLIDNSGNYVVSAGVATRVLNNFYFKVDSVGVTSVTLQINSTVDGAAAKIGQFIVTKQVYQLVGGGSMDVNPSVKQFTKELSDGGVSKVYVRSTNDYDVKIVNSSNQERYNLMQIYDINKRDAFIFVPRPAMFTDYWDGLGDHVNWVNAFEFANPYNQIIENGWTGKIKLKQSSGIR